ncbi:MAG: NUDIX domain-containing protein [Pseudomonadota bacterium]
MNAGNPKTDSGPVAVRAAATVILIDDRPDLQVFMMKRNANTQFAGGMWVFPGGSVDEGDNAENYQRHCTHRSDAEASAQLSVARGGLAYYVAAIREAFEEAGILLALNRQDESPLTLIADDVRQRFDAWRDQVNDGTVDFLDVIDREGLLLDAGEIHYVARWITPPGPPRRFDTRFFVTRMPASQNPIHDDSELVNSAWVTPQEVIARARAREMGMLPPTLRMIECLAEYSSAAEVMAAAALDSPYIRVPMGGAMADAAAGPSNAEPGWVKLNWPG